MSPKKRANKSQKVADSKKKQKKDDASRGMNGKTTSTGSDSNADILKHLLLDATLESICPPEILEPDRETDLRYPHSDLSPFCCLISALLLSKPFSHRLGMRAIHQVFSAPYSFITPKAVLETGGDERWQALEDAHTLHKEKTSGQFRDLAQLIKDNYPEDYDNGDLGQFHKAAEGDVDKLSDQVCQIKGFAVKTTALFFRRVQLQWEDLFPYADELALAAARDVGLQVKTANELLDLLQNHVGAEHKGEALRRSYVRPLDVLIGKKLDKDIDQVAKEITESSNGASTKK